MAREYPDASILTTMCGGVPCAKPMKNPIADGVMLVGDAAHQINPMTGGGIVPGMRGGMLAGETAAEAIKEVDTSEKYLNRYAKKWLKIGGRNHERFYSIKETVSKLPDEELDSIADAVGKIPPNDRTNAKVFRNAIFKTRSLLVDVMKVFAGV